MLQENKVYIHNKLYKKNFNKYSNITKLLMRFLIAEVIFKVSDKMSSTSVSVQNTY